MQVAWKLRRETFKRSLVYDHRRQNKEEECEIVGFSTYVAEIISIPIGILRGTCLVAVRDPNERVPNDKLT